MTVLTQTFRGCAPDQVLAAVSPIYDIVKDKQYDRATVALCGLLPRYSDNNDVAAIAGILLADVAANDLSNLAPIARALKNSTLPDTALDLVLQGAAQKEEVRRNAALTDLQKRHFA